MQTLRLTAVYMKGGPRPGAGVLLPDGQYIFCFDGLHVYSDAAGVLRLNPGATIHEAPADATRVVNPRDRNPDYAT